MCHFTENIYYVGKCICKGINIIYRYICKASMPTIEEIEAELNE